MESMQFQRMKRFNYEERLTADGLVHYGFKVLLGRYAVAWLSETD
jgi:hypothetical protein